MTEKKTCLGIGMIGYGFMGRAHSMSFNRMAEVFYPMGIEPKLVTMAGTSEDKVASAAKRHGYQDYTTNWRNMLSDSRIDIIDNGAPTFLHAEPCIEAFTAGKHVIVEKPFALTLEDAKKMKAAADQAAVKGIYNLVAFNYRFVPALRLARKLIQDGVLGEIYQYRSVYIGDRHTDPTSPYNWRFDVTKAGGGALTDINSHAIDMMRFLTGQEVESVMGWLNTFVPERADSQGNMHKVTIDEVALLMAKWENGKVATLEASRVATGYKNTLRIEVHGSEGAVIFDLARGNELQYFNRKEDKSLQGFRTISVTEPDCHDFCKFWWPRGHNFGWEHNHLHMLYHFMNCIADGAPVSPWAATFDDGLKCQEIIEAAKLSHARKAWVTISELR